MCNSFTHSAIFRHFLFVGKCAIFLRLFQLEERLAATEESNSLLLQGKESLIAANESLQSTNTKLLQNNESLTKKVRGLESDINLMKLSMGILNDNPATTKGSLAATKSSNENTGIRQDFLNPFELGLKTDYPDNLLKKNITSNFSCSVTNDILNPCSTVQEFHPESKSLSDVEHVQHPYRLWKKNLVLVDVYKNLLMNHPKFVPKTS